MATRPREIGTSSSIEARILNDILKKLDQISKILSKIAENTTPTP